MPSKVFEAEQVVVGEGLFQKVRLGFNSKAGCLNLMVPGSKAGAILIESGLGSSSSSASVRVENGVVCRVGNEVKVTFSTEAAVDEFVRCIAPGVKPSSIASKRHRPRLFFGELKKAEFIDGLADAMALFGTGSPCDVVIDELQDSPVPSTLIQSSAAPSTPPRRKVAELSATPPRPKRPRNNAFGPADADSQKLTKE
eukprot:TRINITY_DN41856_c0_g1_i1.p1 TRINITY_DN41856_c0_g1~~TRINITY_DN41856_c0_g1_i1.p1  ORF type:complete len:210 (+),score=59.82 TRINITY_DN41856_c0_g1_i1:38-631(+)